MATFSAHQRAATPSPAPRGAFTFPLTADAALPFSVGKDGQILATPGPLPGAPAAFRLLSAGEEAEAMEAATLAAGAAGVENPKEGHPIYDLHYRANVLLLACVDADSPPDAPRPFFSGGIEELLAGVTEPVLTYVYRAFVSFAGEHRAELHSLQVSALVGFLDQLGTVPLRDAMSLFDTMSDGLRFAVTRALLVSWQDSRRTAAARGKRAVGPS